MLQLTKRTEYALISLVHLTDHAGQVVSAREIGESYPIPRRLLAEVLKDLGHAGLVRSTRGASGGYTLARPAKQITLGQVVSALEGRPTLSCESLGASDAQGDCNVGPLCPIRSPLHRIQQGIWRLLESTTLDALATSSIDPNTLFATTLAKDAS